MGDARSVIIRQLRDFVRHLRPEDTPVLLPLEGSRYGPFDEGEEGCDCMRTNRYSASRVELTYYGSRIVAKRRGGKVLLGDTDRGDRIEDKPSRQGRVILVHTEHGTDEAEGEEEEGGE